MSLSIHQCLAYGDGLDMGTSSSSISLMILNKVLATPSTSSLHQIHLVGCCSSSLVCSLVLMVLKLAFLMSHVGIDVACWMVR